MIRQILLKNDILVRLVAARTYSQPSAGKPGAGTAGAAAAAPKAVSGDVPGLSSKCVHSKSGPIGPGASRDGEYKVPEYYCYDRNSYFEAEIEMSKFRLPQPSAKQ
uniref:Putative mitochondrial nadh-ubiquinone oxidoreductase 9 kDa subunit-like protein n=1 Tax=Culex tarsalis TaxID=7177 RepID=A0A1Q3FN19_CULTA